jgi:hypothetical protein
MVKKLHCTVNFLQNKICEHRSPFPVIIQINRHIVKTLNWKLFAVAELAALCKLGFNYLQLEIALDDQLSLKSIVIKVLSMVLV